MNEAELRTMLQSMVRRSFQDVSISESGAQLIQLPENPVRIYTGLLPDGTPVVNVESPVLLDVPSPRSEVYELICVLQAAIPVGALVVVGASNGDIHLAIRGQLFADGLMEAQLTRAIWLVHSAALTELDRFRRLSPPVGGETAFGI